MEAECPGHTADTDCEEDMFEPCDACNAAQDEAEQTVKMRPDRKATISVQLDESEAPTTIHEVARIILTCNDEPLAEDAISAS